MTAKKPSTRYRLLRSWALQTRKVQYGLRRLESAVDTWTGAILNVALREPDKESLSIDLYDASFRPENDHDGLYAWEAEWFERRLPPPPASILIGAAGAGREASALRELGYRVHAFEPSSSASGLCKLTLGSEFVDQATYREFVATVLRGQDTRLRLAAEASFDAVLLGWGSFGHVLRQADRLELLRACDRIAPAGPILLSIFEPSGDSLKNGMYYTPWGGFLARPPFDELDRQAQTLSRKLVVSLGSPSSYATLLPSS